MHYDKLSPELVERIKEDRKITFAILMPVRMRM